MTSAAYSLLDLRERGSTEKGTGFPTGRRHRWEFELHVARLAAGGSVSVRLEGSPDGSGEDSFTTLYDWGAKTALGRFLVTEPAEATLTIFPDRDLVIRAVIHAHVGDYTIGVGARCPFLDPTVETDAQLLSQGLRNWKDGLERTVEDAERDVLSVIWAPGGRGTFRLDVNQFGVSDVIRAQIARQAEHLFARSQLAKSKAPGAQKTLREMSRVAPGIQQALGAYMAGGGVWRGR